MLYFFLNAMLSKKILIRESNETNDLEISRMCEKDSIFKL